MSCQGSSLERVGSDMQAWEENRLSLQGDSGDDGVGAGENRFGRDSAKDANNMTTLDTPFADMEAMRQMLNETMLNGRR